jgi:uncharacterized protein (TIGR02246 family)
MNRFKGMGLRAYASAAVVLFGLAAWPSAARSQGLGCVPVTVADIEKLFVQWNEALGRSTPDKPDDVVNLYAPDAVLLPTVENGPYIRRADIRKYFEHFLADKPSGKIDERTIRIGCNVAFDAGLYTFTYDPPRPRPPKKATPARFTYVYKYEGGTWLIAHHHSSVWPVLPKP